MTGFAGQEPDGNEDEGAGALLAATARDVCVRDAAQILRPPTDGLPYLRHDRAGELALDGGTLAIGAGRVAGFEPDGGAGLHVDASGCAVVPGFVDCHTHLPFAGWRAGEYEQKVTGVPYEEIARAGGGIAASARAFAATDDDAVLRQARGLAGEMLGHGTTAFETKCGYGLGVEAELRSLRLADRLGEQVAQQTAGTALLAHSVPPGLDADQWMDVVEEMLPRVTATTGARALDIFVETLAFSNEHLARMGRLARQVRPGASRPRRAVRDPPLGARRARARRPLGGPSLLPASRRHRPAGRGRVRRGAAARSRVHGRRGAGARP